MTETANKINETIKALKNLEKANNYNKELVNKLNLQRAELREVTISLDEELKDIEKLEGYSVRGLFHKVLGSKENELEKERQEYLTIALKHKELKKSIELEEFELDLLSKKVLKIEHLETDLEKLMERRASEILRLNLPEKGFLNKILKSLDENVRTQAEIEEAHNIGKISIQHLNAVLSHISQAEKWGNWDMHKGNSRHYDRMKYGAIDHAAQAAVQARNLLTRFQKELNDVGLYNQNLTINIDSFNRFTDVFFDNLISDWIVQRKIKNVLSNVESVKDRVILLLRTLEKDHKTQKDQWGKLDRQKDEIVLKSTKN